jgi:isochorismate synthase EntC
MSLSIEHLKQAAEAKARERQHFEQIRLQRLRTLQHLNKQIDRLLLEEALLQGEIRHLQQTNIQQALAGSDRYGSLV